MGRKKSYDENAVLEKAMFAFWEHGYKGITTRQLAQAMGINQYSLYASFHSKERLFSLALQQYNENFIENGLYVPLSGDNLTKENLRQFLEQFVQYSQAGLPGGCFICNTMVEGSCKNPQAVSVLQRYRQLMTDAFQAIIRNTYPQATEEFIYNKREFLFGALVGLAMQNKMGVKGSTLQNYVNEMMLSLLSERT